MKFYIKWIKTYINNKLNLKNIKNILNKNGFETNINYIPQNYIKTKIINIKKINNNIYNLNIIINNLNKNLNIKLKKNILQYKYIWLNSNLYKKINKNKIFTIIKQKIKNKYILLLYNNIQSYKNIKFLEINIPYNRIECNNIYNISKEICILTKKKFIEKKIIINIKKNNKYKLNIKISKKNIKYFENYKYIIIKNIKYNNKKIIPNYIYNRLENMGFIINNNIFDIINYTSIEFGHINMCLDYDKIKKNKLFIKIKKKYNKSQKNIIITTKKKIIIKNYIKYNKKFIPNYKTKNIILISILFNKNFIKKNYNKNKFNLQIYNNNINKKIQDISIKKTSYIIKNIWKSKKILFKTIKINKTKKKKIKINFSEINKKIGFKIKKKIIFNILKKINCKIINKKKYILILHHKNRYDLNIKEDFIEEIIKFYGFKNIKNKKIKNILKIEKQNQYTKNINNIKIFLSNIGYKEIINFHFSNKILENIFFNNKKYIKIKNPILKKMSILRTSLIPELINNIIYNSKRKNNNIKFFEIGTCYKKKNKKIKFQKKISLIIYGLNNTKNWNIKQNIFNFYDIKGDLELLLKKQKKNKFFYLKKSKYNFLDKKLNAYIYIKNKKIGFIGMINKKIQKYLLIKYPIFLLEIKLKYIIYPNKNKIKKISKFPYNERDITLIINNKISIYKIIYTLKKIKKIKKINIINIFLNNKLQKLKKKNITLNLIIQDNKKTLKEIEINNLIDKCKYILKKKFNALIDKKIE